MLRERSLRPAYLMLAGILVGWGPSLIRSFYYTGNPTYPLFSHLFGTGPWWIPADVVAMAAGLLQLWFAADYSQFPCTTILPLLYAREIRITVTFSAALAILLPLARPRECI